MLSSIKLIAFSLLLTASGFSAAMTCSRQMTGDYSILGVASFGAAGRFFSEQECQRAIRYSGKDLICLSGGRYNYSLFIATTGQIIGSDYANFADCVDSIRSARRGLVCASSIRYQEHRLIRIYNNKMQQDFSSREECLEKLGQ